MQERYLVDVVDIDSSTVDGFDGVVDKKNPIWVQRTAFVVRVDDNEDEDEGEDEDGDEDEDDY